jgi:hypothetical protein
LIDHATHLTYEPKALSTSFIIVPSENELSTKYDLGIYSPHYQKTLHDVGYIQRITAAFKAGHLPA